MPFRRRKARRDGSRQATVQVWELQSRADSRVTARAWRGCLIDRIVRGRDNDHKFFE